MNETFARLQDALDRTAAIRNQISAKTTSGIAMIMIMMMMMLMTNARSSFIRRRLLLRRRRGGERFDLIEHRCAAIFIRWKIRDDIVFVSSIFLRDDVFVGYATQTFYRIRQIERSSRRRFAIFSSDERLYEMSFPRCFRSTRRNIRCRRRRFTMIVRPFVADQGSKSSFVAYQRNDRPFVHCAGKVHFVDGNCAQGAYLERVVHMYYVEVDASWGVARRWNGLR